jgi:hypothetical protein
MNPLSSLSPRRRFILAGLALWLALACLGYGLALRRYAAGLMPFEDGGIQTREGKVLWATISRFSGARFKFEGQDDVELFLPAEFVDDWSKLEQYLREGASIWVKNHPFGFRVFEMRANSNTPFPVRLVEWKASVDRYNHRGDDARTRGLIFLIAGALLLVPVGGLATRRP